MPQALSNSIPSGIGKLKPQDVGLPSFDVLTSTPGISDADRAAMLAQLQTLAQLKANGGPSYQTGVSQFRDKWRQLATGATFVPPPGSTPSATAQSATGPPVAGVPYPPTTPVATAPATTQPVTPAPATDTSLLSNVDFDKALNDLLTGMSGSDPIRQIQQGLIEGAAEESSPGLTANEDAALAQMRSSATQAAIEHSRAISKGASGVGLRGSGQEGELHRGVTKALTQQIMDKEAEIRLAAGQRATTNRSQAFNMAEAFATALENKNVRAMEVLLNAKTAENQLELDRTVIEENIRLGRDTFTEEQRKAMKQEGFTEQQIVQAEEQMIWQRAYQEKIQEADYDLANRNMVLQEKAGNQALDLNERNQAMNELRNNFDMTLQEATFQYTKELGLSQHNLERDKFYMGLDFDKEQFTALQKRLEREFGLQLNEFALKEALTTGQLNLDILNSQRKYDLDVKEQQEKWLATTEARELEERLGMSQIELQKVLQGEQLDYNRERDALEKWMFSEGLAWDQRKFEAQLEAARKKSGGGCLKKTVGAVVGAGVGFVTSGFNPMGALVGGASAVMKANGQDPSALDSIFNWAKTKDKNPGPVPPNSYSPGSDEDYVNYGRPSNAGQSTSGG